jgi:hypothetical protein
MKPHTYSHGALWNNLDVYSILSFQKLIRIYIYIYRERERERERETENGICCIAEEELFKSYLNITHSF